MLENLQQKRGASPRERARLFGTLALIVALGGFIYGGRACSQTAPPPALPTTTTAPPPPAVPLEAAQFERIREGKADPAQWDSAALLYAVREVQRGHLSRVPERIFESVAALGAADPKEWTGRLVEVRGRLLDLDREVYDGKPTADQLWAFALEGEDGARVAVVKAGLGSNPDGDAPADAYRGGGSTKGDLLQEGDFVRVRGIVLQRRTGAVGRLNLDTPTLVLVGREYRRTGVTIPAVPSLAAIEWSKVQDRLLADTAVLQTPVNYTLLRWAGDRGHEKALAEARALGPIQPWGQTEFLEFKRDLERDNPDKHGGDPTIDMRKWTIQQRGRVFKTTGVLLDYVREDWDSVSPNEYDVAVRHKYWIVSDHYANLLFLMESAFPIETFKGVPAPRKDAWPRVEATGIFVQNHSYRPPALAGQVGSKQFSTAPYFHLIDLRPLRMPASAPLWKNPFFWAWVSLAVFGAAFFLVMSRLEKRESAIMREKEKLVRAGARRALRPGGPSGEKGAAGGTSEPGGSGDQGPPTS